MSFSVRALYFALKADSGDDEEKVQSKNESVRFFGGYLLFMG